MWCKTSLLPYKYFPQGKGTSPQLYFSHPQRPNIWCWPLGTMLGLPVLLLRTNEPLLTDVKKFVTQARPTRRVLGLAEAQSHGICGLHGNRQMTLIIACGRHHKKLSHS